MRDFDQALRDHLATEAQTTCTCWILRRSDGQVFGFTDHDNDLVVENVSCVAASGFNPTQAISDLGLSVDSQDIEGAIADDTITADDLIAGRYDDARVEVWMVNWQSPEQRHHLRTAILGEISRDDHLFKAELRGLTSLLDQQHGRTFSRTCEAILGDTRCKFDLSNPDFVFTGSVAEVLNRRTIFADVIVTQPKDWFAHGNLEWTSGANHGLKVEVDGSSSSLHGNIRLWKAMPHLPVIGDSFVLSAGCDKTFATCKKKFGNHLNFQGFPHMPGTDFALGYARNSVVHDGSPLVE